MEITMVSLRYSTGAECPKCQEARQYLAGRGLLERISRCLHAEDGDPESEGVRLAVEHGMTRFPFFVVSDGNEQRVYSSVVKLVREVLAPPA
ncbi:MAG TPA: hypothetical protein PLD23_02515 [Armatimonadota bacterium]|nr:hypothetical protein [Armatimonadota bacterium]